MKKEGLLKEIQIELGYLDNTVNEIIALNQQIGINDPSVWEKTAAASFLSQFYNGIENILKRISLFNDIQLPSGENWHIELFERFIESSSLPLPILFDSSLAKELRMYRKFRHVVIHSYGFQIDWERLKTGIERLSTVYTNFQIALKDYLRSLR